MGRSRLLDEVRAAMRVKHYSIRTEQSYIQWIKRYIYFHNKKHPAEMGEPELSAFLTHLAVNKNVTASTQNQALSALLFLYKQVLGVELPWLSNVVWLAVTCVSASSIPVMCISMLSIAMS